MFIKQRKGWEIAESQVTPEHMFLNRRAFMETAASAAAFFRQVRRGPKKIHRQALSGQAQCRLCGCGTPGYAAGDQPDLQQLLWSGTSKQIYDAAEALPIRPWSIVIDGEVEAR